MTKNERLSHARVKSGKSQQELAELLGVSQAYISGIEKNQAFSFKKAKLIAPLLGVDADWLYFGDKTDGELSQKSNNSKKNQPERNTEGDNIVDFNLHDKFDVNHKLTYTQNSTLEKGKQRNQKTENHWKELCYNQQKQIQLLYQQIEILNQIALKR